MAGAPCSTHEMNGRSTGPLALAAFVLFSGATAVAQNPPAEAPAAAPPADSSAAPAASAAPVSSAAPKSNEPAVTGYAYHEHPSPPAPASFSSRHHARLAHHGNEALAQGTGFEMLADGGSRLFVQLSRQVDVDQAKDMATAQAPRHKHGRAAKQAPGAALTRLTYVLKGTELLRRNDGNPLETIDFNTPIVRARLVPSGRDLHFVILLRADVTPTMKTIPTKDNGAMLQIDFPQGSYVTSGSGSAYDPAPNEPANGALPSRGSQGAPGAANGSGDTNGSMGPQ